MIRTKQKLKSIDLMEAMADMFLARGAPLHVCSANVPEFVAQAVQGWIAAVGARTAYVEPPQGTLYRELERKAQKRATHSPKQT